MDGLEPPIYKDWGCVMSMANCIECQISIDADDGCYVEGQDYALCDTCREDYDDLDTNDRFLQRKIWQETFNKWLYKPIRSVA